MSSVERSNEELLENVAEMVAAEDKADYGELDLFRGEAIAVINDEEEVNGEGRNELREESGKAPSI